MEWTWRLTAPHRRGTSGGEGEIDRDRLESGIEINARPPGKQPQQISLLSGGERTMTAVALLFAIYMVKPSPFCVLDEMDAPLDESNINRFIKILQRFVSLSQFVVITHNKRTISMSDVLYGVTMGGTWRVALRLHAAGARRQLATRTARGSSVDRGSGDSLKDVSGAAQQAPGSRSQTISRAGARLHRPAATFFECPAQEACPRG